MDNKNISYAGFCAVSVKILNTFLFNVLFSSAEAGAEAVEAGAVRELQTAANSKGGQIIKDTGD